MRDHGHDFAQPYTPVCGTFGDRRENAIFQCTARKISSNFNSTGYCRRKYRQIGNPSLVYPPIHKAVPGRTLIIPEFPQKLIQHRHRIPCYGRLIKLGLSIDEDDGAGDDGEDDIPDLDDAEGDEESTMEQVD